MGDLPCSLQAEVISVLAEVCSRDPTELTPSTSLLDLALDSLSVLAVVSHFEVAFDVQLEAFAIERVLVAATVEDVVAAIHMAMPGAGMDA